MKPSRALLVLAETLHGLTTGVARLQADNHAVTTELLDAYSAVTCAYAAALRDRVSAIPEGSPAWPDVIDHLVQRLRQAREEDLLLEPLDVLDQLAGRPQALEPVVLNS
jgi:hypothetical protein